MLINSPRLTDADRAAWNRWETFDRRMAEALAGRLERLADTARTVIEDFTHHTPDPAYASISWGKDSVVVAHLVATSQVARQVPLAYATSAAVPGRVANPEAPLVRDAFLTAHPHVTYYEHDCGLGALERTIGIHRRISGVRGAESGLRKQAMRWHGVTTTNTCRPIGHWTDADLWAYLHVHNLPVHPAYAMSMGGGLERSRLRVHSFGGEDGAGVGRIEWENHYYPDVVAELRGVTRARPV